MTKEDLNIQIKIFSFQDLKGYFLHIMYLAVIDSMCLWCMMY